MNNKIYPTCFNCGAVLFKGKCPNCGYTCDLEDICPRMNSMGKCTHTGKACKCFNYEECETLRKNN